MFKYNADLVDYKNTPLDDAYEILEQAENAKTEKEAIKLAKKAYEKCSDCFDAILFQADLETNISKRDNLLDEGLEHEKKRLEKENYFDKENIGEFYTMFKTRPFIRGLRTKANNLASDGKIKLAKDVCLEILTLNNSDSTGARYLLMAIYAYLEEEQELLKLYKKYNEENLEVLIPLLVLYYKQSQTTKAIKYLKEIEKVNPHFTKMFKGKLKLDEYIDAIYYQIGSPSEVVAYLREYGFLLLSVPTIE